MEIENKINYSIQFNFYPEKLGKNQKNILIKIVLGQVVSNNYGRF